MKMNPDRHSRTAILIFANSPEEESRRKSLLDGAELFRDIMNRTLSEVTKTGLPYFHIDEHRQRGADFGSRFLNAMDDVFSMGYQSVIAIGADTPRISARQILAAAAKLSKGELVLGPSTDGGFYLIGLHKSQFVKQEMTRLPWQKSGLCKHLIARLKVKGLNINMLKPMVDLDKKEDLERLANGFRNIPYSIFRYLQRLVRHRGIATFTFVKHFFSAILQSHYNKGSPVYRLLNY